MATNVRADLHVTASYHVTPLSTGHCERTLSLHQRSILDGMLIGTLKRQVRGQDTVESG